MSGQERIPFWQVWRLRQRASSLGWGENIPTLRQNGRWHARMTLFGLAIPALLAVLVYTPASLGMIRPPLTLAATIRAWLPVLLMCLALVALSWAWSMAYLRRAEAGEHQAPVTLAGYCYATALQSPAYLFALIGPSREQAQWFCLPIGWDPVVEPGDAYYTLSYIPATGFVERLLRTGSRPRALTQSADVIVRRDQHGARIMSAPEGAASQEQRTALLREARRHGWTWRMSDRALSTIGWLYIAIGCVYAVLLVVLAPLLAPSERLTPENAQVLSFLVPIFGVVSIAAFVAGGVFLRMWVKRRGAAAASIEIEGEQVCWTPTGPRSSTLGPTLAQVRLDNGEQRVFLVPVRLSHRVRRMNARVRVAYNEQAGPVLDYRPVDSYANHSTA